MHLHNGFAMSARQNMSTGMPDFGSCLSSLVIKEPSAHRCRHPVAHHITYKGSVLWEFNWPSSHSHSLRDTVIHCGTNFVYWYIQEAEAQLDEGKVGFVEASALTHKQVLEMAVAEASRRVHEATK